MSEQLIHDARSTGDSSKFVSGNGDRKKSALGSGMLYHPSTFPNAIPGSTPPRGPNKSFCKLSADRFFPTQCNHPSYTTEHCNHPRKRKMLFPAGSSATLCLALVLAVGQRALAANDWSAPCTQGKCSWDLPGDSGASGTVNIVSSCFTRA